MINHKDFLLFSPGKKRKKERLLVATHKRKMKQSLLNWFAVVLIKALIKRGCTEHLFKIGYLDYKGECRRIYEEKCNLHWLFLVTIKT